MKTLKIAVNCQFKNRSRSFCFYLDCSKFNKTKNEALAVSNEVNDENYSLIWCEVKWSVNYFEEIYLMYIKRRGLNLKLYFKSNYSFYRNSGLLHLTNYMFFPNVLYLLHTISYQINSFLTSKKIKMKVFLYTHRKVPAANIRGLRMLDAWVIQVFY